MTTLSVSQTVRVNAPILRRLRDGDPPDSLRSLARELERDAGNLSRTHKVLERDGLVDGLTLTAAGVQALAALEAETGAAGATNAPATPAGGEIALDLIDRDPDLNPRKRFDESELAALAASIKDKGVIQPILLRPGPDFATLGRYLLVAGERRFRASHLAGVTTINAVVRDLSDAQAAEIALIENIQRADLSPIEEARAFRRIVEKRQEADPDLSQRAAADVIVEATRKSLRFIEQRLQLLQLSEADQARMELPEDDRNHLTVTAARAIIQKRPAPVEPAVMLVLAEVALAEIVNGGHPVVDDVAAVEDPHWQKLRNGYQVYGPDKVYGEDGQWTGQRTAYASYNGDRLLEAHCPQFFDDDAGSRDAFIDDLRAKVLGESVPFNGPYVTPWLNGPFELTEERLAEVAKAIADSEAAKAEHERRGRELAESRERAREAGERARATAQQITLDLRQKPPAAIDARLAQGLVTLGFQPPFHVKGQVLLDAKGDFLVSLRGYGGAGDYEAATLELVVNAINGACGLATPEEDDGQAKTAEQFTAWLADRFVTMHGATAADAADNAAKALARVLESEETRFGDPDLDWSQEAAEIVADGWAEDHEGVDTPELEGAE